MAGLHGRISGAMQCGYPVIRSHAKNAIIIVGTPNWSQYVDEAADSPLTGYSNIMYALHFMQLRIRMSFAISW